MSKPLPIFLDQNHWIYLAQAIMGQPHQPGHIAAADYLTRCVDRGEIFLPISIIHLIEHMRTGDPKRRARLAEVFERLSQGWFFAPWSDILPTEVLRAAALTFHSSHVSPPAQVFGRGYMFAVGSKARAIFSEHWPETEQGLLDVIASKPGALLDLLTFPNESGRVKQKSHLSDLNHRNVQAAEIVRTIRKPYPKNMQKRAQLATYTLEHQNLICHALDQIGKSFEDFLLLGREGLTTFFSHIPSLDVDCQLTLYRDRQWSKPVEPNDVNDIANLVTALPYCNVVVTERFWARAIEETGLKDKYGTTIYTDISQLMLS